MLLAKTILNNIEVLISQALIFSNISHDKCVKRIRWYARRKKNFRKCFLVIQEISISEKELRKIKKALDYRKNNLIDSDGNVYLTVDSLIEINNIITGSNDIALRKVNVKPYESDKTYMSKDLIEDKIYQIINQINGKKILFNTCKVLFNTFKQNTPILWRKW